MSTHENGGVAGRRSRRIVRVVLAAMGTAGLWMLMLYLLFWRPQAVLDGIDDKLRRCGPKQGLRCIADSGADSLGLAGWLPWTSQRADAIAETRDYYRLYWRFLSGDSGTGAKDARTLVSMWRRVLHRRELADPFWVLHNRGHHDLVLANAAHAVTEEQRSWVAAAALVHADLDAVPPAPADGDAVARQVGLFDTPDWLHRRRRGALLCLLGRRTDGLSLLRKARRGSSFSLFRNELRVARRACGEPALVQSHWRVLRPWDLAALAMAGPADPGSRWVLLHLLTPRSSGANGNGVALVAQAVAEGPVDPRALLATMFRARDRTAAEKQLDAAMAKLDRAIGRHLWIVDPRMWTKAADAIAAMAARPVPAMPNAQFRGVDIMPAAAAAPAKYLRIAAGTIRYVAALQYAAIGERDRGRVALTRALTEVGPKLAAELVTRSGDPRLLGPHAVRLIDEKRLADVPAAKRPQLYLTSALYLETRGELARARAHADKALALATGSEHAELRKRIGWVIVALAYRTDSVGELSGLPEQLIAGARRPNPHGGGRWVDVDTRAVTWSELPALIYAVGRLDAGAVERVAGGGNVPAPIHRYQRARAEAARWAGDADAHALWTKRAQRLEALLRDHKSMVLAGLAGL